MPAENHPDYKAELEHSRYILGYVEKSLETTIAKKQKIDSDVDRMKKHFNSDNSQNYIDLMVNTTLQDSLTIRLKNLIAARSKPYFARIDFREDGKEKAEQLYIGKMSLMRDEDQKIIIIDWRAPISSLYYEERLGRAGYLCPDGRIEGDLMLKRQFSFEEGVLKDIFDIDITTNDEFLQAHLGANADNRLKDIVSTIQAEQNRIIRADMWTPLIVQGVAGSGKTTIALHRIAYLVYTYEKSFEPENFMIIAPNKLFLNYISEVLPELGVDKVKQTTFEDFAMELIGKKLKIRDANEKLVDFVDRNSTKEQITRNELVRKASEFKSSMTFKEVIDDYIEAIERDYIPKKDFKIGSQVIYSYEEINDLFHRQYKNWPVAQRLNEIKKHLNNRFKVKKESIINNLHDQCDAKIRKIKATMAESEERQKLIIRLIDKKNAIIDKLQTYSKKAANEYIKGISKLNPMEYYKELIMKEDLFYKLVEGRLPEKQAEFLREHTEKVLKSGFVELEDLAPIIYLKYKIYGMDEKIPVKHIVIDEAQDFSVFQLYVIKKIVRDSSFTILGDLCQGIHSYRGVLDWSDVMKHAFDDRKSQMLTLEQSYRTTVEIMEAANKVIGRIDALRPFMGKPVIRHGEKVRLIKKQNLKEIASDILDKIDEFKEAGYKSIAVICKTMDECKDMASLMKKGGNSPVIITGGEKEYKSGVVIVPSYLAKGLEFDVVMIANANRERYGAGELDTKLMYVSMTRPLHKLYIYYHGELTPLLEEMAE